MDGPAQEMQELQETLRYRLTVAYRGTAYHGWQRQLPPGGGELPTVQNALRLALQRAVGHPVVVTGASRTDAGVHALGQVASFDTVRDRLPPDRLVQIANAKLPDDVAVTAIARVAADFDVIKDAREKAYRYSVRNAAAKDVFAGDLALRLPRPRLDEAAMTEAARHVVGRRDFASLCKPGHGRESTVRTVTRCDVRRDGDRVEIEVAGDGFLWNQVRILAGTLVRVGEGRLAPGEMPGILAARDRLAAGPTAPARGLCLLWVRHDAPR